MPRKEDRPARQTVASAARERTRNAETSGMLQRQRSEADIAFMDSLAQLLKDHDLAEIELTRTYGEDDELQVRLSRYAPAAPVAATAAPMAALPSLPLPPTAAPAAAPAEPSEDLANAVTSPMVGTVYLAPEPGAAPFVSEGARVEEGKPLLIIEAMKTMNQIPSPKSGVVKKVLVENGQPIEFGAPLMIIE